MDKENISYLAGLFDGEGCITYKKYLRTWSKKPKAYNCWVIRMEVSMTDKPVIDYMHKVLGVGTVRPKTKKTPPTAKTEWKDQWRWNVSHRNAYEIAKAIAPFAITKKDKLLEIGINVNTIPVLDVLRNNTNSIIGDRSFSKHKKIVKELGRIAIKVSHSKKIISVIKHIPGHGCSAQDSHLSTPKVNLNKKILNKIDFYPFKSTSAKLAMTAHIIYSKIDSKNVSTFSKKIIKEIIRKKIGYKGILMSDDISMKALNYDLITNAKKSLLAGCNLVLYCAGNIKDNFKLIKSVPYIDKFTSQKTSEIYKILR